MLHMVLWEVHMLIYKADYSIVFRMSTDEYKYIYKICAIIAFIFLLKYCHYDLAQLQGPI